MTTKQVIAYYLHEGEQAEVGQAIHDATFTNAYAVGLMDEAAIAALEDQGIIVEVLAAAEQDLTLGGQGLEMHTFESAGPVTLGVPPLTPTLHPTKDNVFLVELAGPVLLEDWRQKIEGFGIFFEEYIPPARYSASLSLDQVAALKSLSFVEDVTLQAPDSSSSVVFTEIARSAPSDLGFEVSVDLVYDVLLHRAEEMPEVEQWLEDHGVKIIARGKRKLRVEIAKCSPLTREVEALREVSKIQEFVVPELANDAARRLLELVDPATGLDTLGQTGAGEIVAIADSGLDRHHPDFQGRVRSLFARGRPGDASDPHGHGTHVAGSAVGDGSASAGKLRGTAPEAQLVFQSIMDSNGKLGGLPVELEELFDEAYQEGARIHSNSWSADTKSFYTFNSEEVDEYVHKNPDFLVVIAAGNNGTARDPFNSGTGFVDWLSMGSPATSKNALTVGASRSDRTSGGKADKKWGEFNRIEFPDPPIADEKISGDPEGLAAFSSRGPCGDRRIKPELVAPGTDILSTRASTAPDVSYWGPGTDSMYAYMGGTSMSTPLVTGCAALVRQYYREGGHEEPSASLIKATLVNSTRWLTGNDAVANHTQNPNYHQGFGALQMSLAIPNPSKPWLSLIFRDSWKGPGAPLDSTGDRRRHAFTVNGGPELRICLVWTDPPGRSIQNTLGLIVETPLDPPKIVGNQDRPQPLDRMDRANNVQIVRIKNPPPGNYMAVVFARNLLRPTQDYALVVTGDLGPAGLMEV